MGMEFTRKLCKRLHFQRSNNTAIGHVLDLTDAHILIFDEVPPGVGLGVKGFIFKDQITR